MNVALTVLTTMVVLMMAVWIAIFGTVGALLARRHGRSGTQGFLIGTFLGPVGWMWLLVKRPRAHGPSRGVYPPTGRSGADLGPPREGDTGDVDDDVPIP